MKKQARDIAKTSNGKVVLVAADELKVTSSFYGSIFAEKEKINGKTEYSKIPISLLEVGGSKKNVTFYQNHGFEIMEEGTPLQIKGDSWV